MLHNKSKIENTGFPPYLSVRIPNGNLIMEPVRIGIPRSQPVSTTDQLKILLSTR